MNKDHSTLILVLIFLAALLFSRQQNVVVDNWEIPHNRRQPPEKVMDAIGLKKGMDIGEIGAGRGRYAVWLAHRVGPDGRVYANDIDSGSLDYLRSRCRRDNIANIITITGTVEDPKFPRNKLDIAFMINTYHHLEKPVELMRNILPALKPGGKLAIVEHDPSKSERISSPHSSTTPGEVTGQAREAGFRLGKIISFLQEDNIYIFEPILR